MCHVWSTRETSPQRGCPLWNDSVCSLTYCVLGVLREGRECWLMKLLLLSIPLSLPCVVWCNTEVQSKAAQRAAAGASSCLSASNRDSVNVANLRVRHDTKSHTAMQRKGLCHNYTSLFLILSLLHWHQRGGESLCPTVGQWSQRKNFPFALWRRNRPTEGGCRHADLRIASGTVRVKVKKKREKDEGGYT